MRIKISGVDRLISRLKAYQKTLPEKQRRLLSELAKIGIDTAAVRFQTAQYDGENDVVVHNAPEWTDDNTLMICAEGNAVMFIEFGTGVHYAEAHPKAAEMGAIRGAYGQGKGVQDSWGYYGAPGTNGRILKETDRGTVVLTQGNPPARAMYDAGKEMRGQIACIAKEVFHGD